MKLTNDMIIRQLKEEGLKLHSTEMVPNRGYFLVFAGLVETDYGPEMRVVVIEENKVEPDVVWESQECMSVEGQIRMWLYGERYRGLME